MNKFLRVRKSEQFSPQKTSFMTEVLKKNHFIYLDFSDESIPPLTFRLNENSRKLKTRVQRRNDRTDWIEPDCGFKPTILQNIQNAELPFR